MSEKPLHVLTAEAIGWTRTHYPSAVRADHPCGDIMIVDNERMRWKGRAPDEMLVGPEACTLIPRYDTSWEATGPLIERYGIEIHSPRLESLQGKQWCALWWIPLGERGGQGDNCAVEALGETPLIAVCHLLLSLHQSGRLK